MRARRLGCGGGRGHDVSSMRKRGARTPARRGFQRRGRCGAVSYPNGVTSVSIPQFHCCMNRRPCTHHMTSRIHQLLLRKHKPPLPPRPPLTPTLHKIPTQHDLASRTTSSKGGPGRLQCRRVRERERNRRGGGCGLRNLHGRWRGGNALDRVTPSHTHAYTAIFRIRTRHSVELVSR